MNITSRIVLALMNSPNGEMTRQKLIKLPEMNGLTENQIDNAIFFLKKENKIKVSYLSAPGFNTWNKMAVYKINNTHNNLRKLKFNLANDGVILENAI